MSTVTRTAGIAGTFAYSLSATPVTPPVLTIYSDPARTVVAVAAASTVATSNPAVFTCSYPATLPAGSYFLQFATVFTTGQPALIDNDDQLVLTAASGSVGNLVDAPTYARVTGDTTTTTDSANQALTDAQNLANEHCNRQFAYGTYTETLYVYGDGKVYPKATPIASVTSPANVTTQGAGVYIGVISPWPIVSGAGAFNAGVPPQSTVTYTGGYTTATLPFTVARCIARIAWHLLHPVVLPGIPAGASSMHVGDVSVSTNAAGGLAGLDGLDAGILRDLRGYVRQQVRGW